MSFDPLLTVLGLTALASPTVPTTYAPTATRGGIAIAAGVLPSSPTTGTLAIDSGASNALKWWDGSAWQSAVSVGTIGGSVAATQVAYGSGTNTIAGSNGFTFDAVNVRLGVSDTGVPFVPLVTLHLRKNTNCGLRADTYSNTATATAGLQLYKARGTAASPTAVQSGDTLGFVGAYGYGATGFSNQSRANFAILAAETWTDTAQGTYITIDTTAAGTAAATERMRFYADGGVKLSGTNGTFTTSPGNGVLSITQNQEITPLSGTVLQLIGSNNVNTQLEMAAFGTAVNPHIVGRRGRNNPNAPGAVQSGDIMMDVSACGYDGVAWSAAYPGMQIIASQNWAVGSHGAYIAFSTTNNNTTVATEKVRLWQDGGFQIGGTFTTPLGVGNLQIAGTVTSGLNGSFNGVTVGLPASGNTASTVVGSGAGGFSQDTALGASALALASGGSNRVAIGYNALTAVTTGNRNTAVGALALQALTTSSNNTAIGYAAGVSATGNSNVFVGAFAGFNVTTGGSNFYVGNVQQASLINDRAYSLMYGTFSGTAASLTGQNLTVNGTFGVNNSGGVPQSAPAGTVGQVTGAASSVSRVLIDSFGTGIYSSFAGRSARGTVAAPTALQAGDEIIHFSAWGYGATAYSSSYRAAISMFTAEIWSDVAQGTRIGVFTTAPGTAVTSEKVRFWGDGGVQIGGTFTASPGIGGFKTSGAIFNAINSIATAGGTTAMAATDNVVIFTGSNVQTYTLTASGSTATGRQVYVKNRSTGAVTITRGGSDTIDGSTTSYTLPAGAAILLYLNATDWCVF